MDKNKASANNTVSKTAKQNKHWTKHSKKPVVKTKHKRKTKTVVVPVSKMTRQIIRHKIDKCIKMGRFTVLHIEKTAMKRKCKALRKDEDLYIEKKPEGLLVFNKKTRQLTLYM